MHPDLVRGNVLQHVTVGHSPAMFFKHDPCLDFPAKLLYDPDRTAV